MDEATWRRGTNVAAMLECIKRQSNRKLRLFQVACCRRAWPWIPPGPCRDGVDVAERYAEGAATNSQRIAADRAIDFEETVTREDIVDVNARSAVRSALRKTMGAQSNCSFLGSAAVIAWAMDRSAPEGADPRALYQEAYQASQYAERELLRCIFGNPFRPITVDPVWLGWHDGTIPQLARSIYEEDRFEDLPVLGDALEEAGCDHPDVLAHCRSPSLHVRGCWVIDMLLGKS